MMACAPSSASLIALVWREELDPPLNPGWQPLEHRTSLSRLGHKLVHQGVDRSKDIRGNLCLLVRKDEDCRFIWFVVDMQ